MTKVLFSAGPDQTEDWARELDAKRRELGVAFDPADANTLYAGSAGGGLWRSTTGGIGPTHDDITADAIAAASKS